MPVPRPTYPFQPLLVAGPRGHVVRGAELGAGGGGHLEELDHGLDLG